MIVGIVGFAQTGKDEVSRILSNHSFHRVAFADRVKRVCIDIFDFAEWQMWGTIEQKEAPDLRYPREHTWDQDKGVDESKCLCCGAHFNDPDREPCYLTPRYAMKIVGTEGARHCWADIWVKRALEDAALMQSGYTYSRRYGVGEREDLPTMLLTSSQLLPAPKVQRHVVITDCRFINEVTGVLVAGGQVYRIRRPGYEKPAFDHASETEQLQIPDSKLNGVIYNDGTLEDLEHTVLQALGMK